MAAHPQRLRRPGARGDVRRSGEWVCEFVRGPAAVELIETETSARSRRDHASTGADAPTVLLYGHFDVQPPAPLSS